MQTQISIGALAANSGCNIPTIRYYEQIGLLPLAGRTAGGHRYYRTADLERLQFIKRCRDFGFPIEQVRAMVALFENGDSDCIEVRDAAQAQLEAVRVKLDELRVLEASLAAFVSSCDASCVGGASKDCCIIEDLSPERQRRSPAQNTCAEPVASLDVISTELRRRR